MQNAKRAGAEPRGEECKRSFAVGQKAEGNLFWGEDSDSGREIDDSSYKILKKKNECASGAVHHIRRRKCKSRPRLPMCEPEILSEMPLWREKSWKMSEKQ